MKFSTIVLALATVVAPSAAEHVCHTEAIFTYASDDTPSISNEAEEFLGSVMVDTFNEAYAIEVINDDATTTREVGNTRGARKLWTNTRPGGNRCGPTCSNDDDSRMLSPEVPTGVRMLWINTRPGGNSCGPTCSNDDDSRMLSSEVPAGVRMLWTNTRPGGNNCGPTCSNDDDSRMLTGSAEVPEVAGDARKLWRGWSSSGRQLWTNTRPGGNRCGPTCSNDDDSRMLTSSEVVPAGHRKLWTNTLHGSGRFTAEFGAPKEHAQWEKLFLEKGRTYTELTGLQGATIVLSDCHIE